MKAIILAAGVGSRITEKIDGIPKSTLPLGDGKPLIRKAVENMVEEDIQPVVCVGYKKKLIMAALENLPVKYYDNPFFSITNNIASLWFAREEFFNEDIILTSADLYYPKDFLRMLMSSESSMSMLVDSSRIQTGDFYFSVKDGYIQEYGPNVPLDRRTYEYMGMTRIDKSLVEDVGLRIDDYIQTGKFNMYFEDMLISMNMHSKQQIDFLDVRGFYWKEFDYYEDYEEILKYEQDLYN